MALICLDRRRCAIVAVDLQSSMMSAIYDAERVLRRSQYILGVAKALEIPVFATTQNASRLGGFSFELEGVEPIDKMSFSVWGSPGFREAFEATGVEQVVLVGVETHICIALSVNDLLKGGYEVVVCPDAVSSTNQERHKLGMERIRDAGAIPAHSESVAYDLLQTADDPRFRDVLRLTKDLY